MMRRRLSDDFVDQAGSAVFEALDADDSTSQGETRSVSPSSVASGSPMRPCVFVNRVCTRTDHPPTEMLFEMMQDSTTFFAEIAMCRVNQRLGTRGRVAMRPQNADRAPVRHRTKRRDVRHDRNGTAGTRFKQRISRSFVR